MQFLISFALLALAFVAPGMAQITTQAVDVALSDIVNNKEALRRAEPTPTPHTSVSVHLRDATTNAPETTITSEYVLTVLLSTLVDGQHPSVYWTTHTKTFTLTEPAITPRDVSTSISATTLTSESSSTVTISPSPTFDTTTTTGTTSTTSSTLTVSPTTSTSTAVSSVIATHTAGAMAGMHVGKVVLGGAVAGAVLAGLV